ncbi:cilia- and flagella-associated protein 157 [Bradysia coprophila]|uniref:cilia- and flagella-associated protein 157 n=1 Tax=Bradysia coprophila TaxID=38358 RepID=UPI00187DA1F1|nr:cilia- and flagella-associated protein 157 [Bradysia coprophila]
MPQRKPRKGNKKAKGDDDENENQLSNVDQAFYETTIADLAQKLATCKEQNIKMQEKMEEMDAQFRQFEEDRTDVTGYLDRSNLIKQANIIDLEEKLSELGKVRHEETKEFQRIIKEWEVKFKAMQEELTSEIKLLTGKLVSLEEFRIQRDELMSKFDQQESDLKEQSQRHKDLLQEMERKQIVDKNTLKNDVENKLLELSSEFTKASEVRISAHVQRLVRENIALNNELDRIMFTHRRLQNEMKSIKDRDKQRSDATATYCTENKQLIRTCDVQIEIIKRLTSECEKMKLTNQVLMDAARMKENAEKRELKAVKELEEYRAKTHLLEQHVHAIRTECAKHKVIVQDQIDESDRLANVLTQIKYTVKSACRGQNNPDDDPRFREAQRQNLLSELLGIFLTLDEPLPKKSFDTIEAMDDMYNKGDLGMTPSKSISSILRMRRPFARRFVSDIELGVNDDEDVEDDDSLPTIKSYPSCPIIELESGSVIAYSMSGSKTDDQEVEETGFDDSSDEDGDDEKTTEKPVKKKIQPKSSTEKAQDSEAEKKSTGSQRSQEKVDEKLLEREKSSSQKSVGQMSETNLLEQKKSGSQSSKGGGSDRVDDDANKSDNKME